MNGKTARFLDGVMDSCQLVHVLFMLVVAINIKHTLIAGAKMFEELVQLATVFAHITYYHTVRAGCLASPVERSIPAVQM